MEEIKQVEEFHLAFGHPVLEEIGIPNWDRQDLRARLMEEEVSEYAKETKYDPSKVDIEKVAKELADIMYVTIGSILEFGLQNDFDRIFAEVHRSNMSKLGEDGKPIYNANGKVMKGPNYTEADLSFLKS